MAFLTEVTDSLDLARGNYLLGQSAVARITKRTNAVDDKVPIIKHTLRHLPQAERFRTLASSFATKTEKNISAREAEGGDRFAICLDIAQDMEIINL